MLSPTLFNLYMPAPPMTTYTDKGSIMAKICDRLNPDLDLLNNFFKSRNLIISPS